MTQPHPVTAVLQAGVVDGVFPGAVLQVRLAGGVVYHQAVGRTTYAVDASAVTLDTVYDLASLTKPLATTRAMLQLIVSRRLDLAQPLRELLPEVGERPLGRATMEQLLRHAAGLPAWRPYYERLSREPEAVDAHGGCLRAKRVVLDWIAAEPLESAPGSASVYSDLGFMLLGFVIERVLGRPMEEWWRGEVMAESKRPTLDFIERPRTAASVFGATVEVAPTEEDPWRGRLLRGEVHDENAWALGGVAGHAGLFGTAEAVARSAQWWVEGWESGDTTELSRLVRRFTSRAANIPGSSRGLGWDTPSPPSSSGRWFPSQSFGHLGFTGTSLWVDPTSALVVALVANRVHPTRTNDKIKLFRPQLHDAVYREWVGGV